MGIMDIYEVELCRRGRWEQQDARFVAAGDADEAAYKVTGEHLHSEGDAGRFGYASRGLGTEAHRRSCFTPPEAASGRHHARGSETGRATAFERFAARRMAHAKPEGNPCVATRWLVSSCLSDERSPPYPPHKVGRLIRPGCSTICRSRVECHAFVDTWGQRGSAFGTARSCACQAHATRGRSPSASAG